jgi:CYTH domain-containing protein
MTMIRNISSILGTFKSLSMEGTAVDGRTRNEIEYNIYMKIADFSVLGKALSKNRIEQIPLYTESEGKGSLMVRSRKIVTMDSGDADDKTVGTVAYVLTTKTPSEVSSGTNMVSRREAEIAGSQDIHELFLAVADPKRVIAKDRFRFSAPNSDLFWDVDLFIRETGGYTVWAKAEVEVPSKDTPMPDLPFQPADWFTADDSSRRDRLMSSGEVRQ